jgi:hypothetical protein
MKENAADDTSKSKTLEVLFQKSSDEIVLGTTLTTLKDVVQECRAQR